MSYGLNVEMHKQTEICKRLDAIIRQVLPFLSGEVRLENKTREVTIRIRKLRKIIIIMNYYYYFIIFILFHFLVGGNVIISN